MSNILAPLFHKAVKGYRDQCLAIFLPAGDTYPSHCMVAIIKKIFRIYSMETTYLQLHFMKYYWVRSSKILKL